MAETTTRASFVTNPLVFDASARAVEHQTELATATPTGELLPDAVRTWLARARLLEGVPFQHLVADSELLPPESIRFFFLDREWTDALTQGALSVGTVTTLDRDQLQALHASIRDEVDAEERRVRMVGGEDVAFAPAGAISGFLLRSRAVSGWPAVHVRGYTADVKPDNAQIAFNDPRRMRLLRLERLAPAVLLCLFDGIPTVVHIEEPRQGVQYGVDLGANAPEIHLRNIISTKFLDDQPNPVPPFRIRVPRRLGSPGIVHVKKLGNRMTAVSGTQITTASVLGLTSAGFAMEMLQFPFRQVFGPGAPITGALAEGESAAGDEERDGFRPTISMEEIQAWDEDA
jgi:hypothetical protein